MRRHRAVRPWRASFSELDGNLGGLDRVPSFEDTTMLHTTPLVEAARAGDVRAFEELTRRYARRAAAAARSRVGDGPRCEEVVQEAFLDAWLHLRSLREPAAFGAWLRRIVRKHCDRVTRRKALPLVPLTEPLPAPPAEDPVERSQLADRVDAALRTLPDGQRLAVALHYGADCDVRQVADYLGVSVGAAKKRLHDARARLRTGGIETMVQDWMHTPAPTTDRRARQIALLVAARSGDLEALREQLAADPTLLERPEPLDPTDPRSRLLVGSTPEGRPLHLAAEGGHAAALTALIEAGADPDARTAAGQSALHVAVQMGHADAVAALLEGGADVDATHRNGLTPLHFAAILGRRDLAERLLGAGADPARAARDGRTPAFWAGAKGHAEVAAVLERADRAGHAEPDRAFVATGIKVVDLFAPMPRGGRVHVVAERWGLGLLVFLAELLQRQADRGVALVALADRFLDDEDFPRLLREVGLVDRVPLRQAATGDGPEAMLDAVTAALGELPDGGLLLVDHAFARLPGFDERVGSVTAVLFEYAAAPDELLPPEGLGRLDATVTLSPALAEAGRWPAVDPLRSWSRVTLDDGAAALVQRARDALTAGEDAGRVEGARSRRLAWYLTQPFEVAETFTGMLGEVVPPEAALADCADILDGRYDDVAPGQFRYVGRAATVRRGV